MRIDALAALLNSLNGQVNGPEARHTFLATAALLAFRTLAAKL
jgi:hypothetical protein